MVERMNVFLKAPSQPISNSLLHFFKKYYQYAMQEFSPFSLNLHIVCLNDSHCNILRLLRMNFLPQLADKLTHTNDPFFLITEKRGIGDIWQTGYHHTLLNKNRLSAKNRVNYRSRFNCKLYEGIYYVTMTPTIY